MNNTRCLYKEVKKLRDVTTVSGGFWNGCPVIFDVIHALQIRSAFSSVSGGRGEKIYELARSGMAIDIASLFIEAHPDPKSAKCDGSSALLLDELEPFLKRIKSIDSLIKYLLRSNKKCIS